MSVKLKRALIDLSAGFLWIAAFAGLCFYCSSRFLISAWLAFLFGAIGLALNYYLFVFFHELGHVAFSKRAGLKPIKINYGAFTVDYLKNLNNLSAGARGEGLQKKAKKSKNIKISFSPWFNKNAGESSFAAVKPVRTESIKTVAFGGLSFSFIYCLAAFLVILLVNNAWLFCLFGAGACSAFYVFSINVIPIDKTNDGALVLFNSYCGELAKMLEFSRLLSSGADICELEKLAADGEKNQKVSAYSEYIRYYIAAENNAEQAVLALNNSSVKKLNSLCDEELFTVLSELIFATSVLADERFLSENSNLIENYFSSDFSGLSISGQLAFVRAHAAYRSALNANEWAAALRLAYKKLVSEPQNFSEFSPLALKVENNLFDFYKKTFSLE